VIALSLNESAIAGLLRTVALGAVALVTLTALVTTAGSTAAAARSDALFQLLQF